MKWFDTSVYIFYGASLLLALGKAGGPAALGKFLEDQYISEVEYKIKLPEATGAEEEDDKQKRVETHQSALWSHPWYIGVAAPLTLRNPKSGHWLPQLLFSSIVVGVFYLLFWYGVFADPALVYWFKSTSCPLFYDILANSTSGLNHRVGNFLLIVLVRRLCVF